MSEYLHHFRPGGKVVGVKLVQQGAPTVLAALTELCDAGVPLSGDANTGTSTVYGVLRARDKTQ